ncbi:MAG TPA: shikimate kinase [Ktedonobacteraceae bacterium]|nr:shikimate kinase [Ktedonobacteraceae bacterium]
MRIILIGMKGCGKSTLGKRLARRLALPFIDSDTEIEQTHRQERGETLPFRQIYARYGAAYFRALDTRMLQRVAAEYGERDFVLSCGGQTPLQEENQAILAHLGTIVYLQVARHVLLQRILAQGVPASFPYPDDPARSLDVLLAKRVPTYTKLAHIIFDASSGQVDELVATLITELQAYDKD